MARASDGRKLGSHDWAGRSMCATIIASSPAAPASPGGLRVVEHGVWNISIARCGASIDILMEGDEQAGGEWNFDSDNRKALPESVLLPDRHRFTPDDTTHEVMALVEQRFGGYFGTLEAFGWPVTRADAGSRSMTSLPKACRASATIRMP